MSNDYNIVHRGSGRNFGSLSYTCASYSSTSSSSRALGSTNYQKSNALPEDNDQVVEIKEDNSNQDKTKELDKNNDGIITDQEIRDYYLETTEQNTAQSGNNTGTKTVYVGEKSYSDVPTTTAADYDPEEYHIPTNEKLKDIPFETNVPAYKPETDSDGTTYYRYGQGSGTAIAVVDNKTEEIINKMFKDANAVYCKDSIEGTTVTRIIRFDDNRELKININCWGQAISTIRTLAEDYDESNPKTGDYIGTETYVPLPSGGYALLHGNGATYDEEFAKIGSGWTSNLNIMKIQAPESQKEYDIFTLYDEDGNQIDPQEDPEKYEQMLDEAQSAWEKMRTRYI